MINRHLFLGTLKIVCLFALVGGLILSGTDSAWSQQTAVDPPNVHINMPEAPQADEAGPVKKTLQAVCWYLPNRLMDILDVPRIHISGGDGLGGSLRATKFMTASWFEDDAFCLGLAKRKPPFFTEQIEERYFGFLAAQEGELDRDPTELGISIHFVAVGLNVALSLGEAVDALVGFVGIDLYGDDHGPFFNDMTAEQRQADEDAAQAYYDEFKENKAH